MTQKSRHMGYTVRETRETELYPTNTHTKEDSLSGDHGSLSFTLQGMIEDSFKAVS
jgi:hypothetical protein